MRKSTARTCSCCRRSIRVWTGVGSYRHRHRRPSRRPARCHRQSRQRSECRPGGAGSAAAAAIGLDRGHDGRAPVARHWATGARSPSRGARQLSTGCDGGGPFEHVAADDPDGVAAPAFSTMPRPRCCMRPVHPTKVCSRPSAWTSEPSRMTGRAGRTTRSSVCKRYAPLPKWKSGAPGSWSGRKPRRSQSGSCWSGSSRSC